eukprot:CFRG7916T1
MEQMTEYEGIKFLAADPNLKYKGLETIGHGSFGYVYKAIDCKTGEVVAIKKIPQIKKKKEEWRDIKKEIEFMRSCTYTHLVAIRGAYFLSAMVWIVMDYCVGSASDLVAVVPGRLGETEIVGIVYQALLGLKHMHSKGRIHRDIKCSNILITNEGVVKLGDFGSVSSKAADVNSFVGTPYWMAPELITAMEEGMYDSKVDIWSLGISTLELAHKQVPLLHMNAMSALYHIPDADSPGLENPEQWSRELNAFVTASLNKTPVHRPDANTLLSTHPLFTNMNVKKASGVLSGLLSRIEKAHVQNGQEMSMNGNANKETTGLSSIKVHAPLTVTSEYQKAEESPLFQEMTDIQQNIKIGVENNGNPPSHIPTHVKDDISNTERNMHDVQTKQKMLALIDRNEHTHTSPITVSMSDTGVHTRKNTLMLEDQSGANARLGLDVDEGVGHNLNSVRALNIGRINISIPVSSRRDDRLSWKEHQYEAKQLQKLNQRKRKELTRGHDKALQDISTHHTQMKARLTMDQEQRIMKMVQQHQIDLDRLDKRDAADSHSFNAKISVEEKAAWKAFEKQSKLTKMNIKSEEKYMMNSKSSSKKLCKEKYTNEISRMHMELEKLLENTKHAEHVELQEEMRRRRNISKLAHMKELLRLEEMQLQDRCKFELSCQSEIQALTQRQLEERGDLAIECSNRAQKMENAWLKQHQQRDIKNMQRRQNEEIKDKPKLRKALRAELRNKQAEQAKRIQNSPDNMFVSQESAPQPTVPLSIATSISATLECSPRSSARFAVSQSMPVDSPIFAGVMSTLGSGTSVSSGEGGGGSETVVNTIMRMPSNSPSSKGGESRREIGPGSRRFSKERKRKLQQKLAALQHNIQTEYNNRVAEIENEIAERQKKEASELAMTHESEEKKWKDAANKKTTDLREFNRAARESLQKAHVEETAYMKDQHASRVAQAKINAREMLEKNAVI